jgi:hypothetical protein
MKLSYPNFFAGLIVGFLFPAFIALCLWPDKTPVKAYPNGESQVVYVRGTRWAVFVGSEDALLDLLDMYGITDCKKQAIYIRGSLTLANQRDSVLHELLHAGTCDTAGDTHNMFYNSETAGGHEGIYKIAGFMSTLLHDNPELANYLIGESK